MDAKDKRIAKLEALRQAALEENAVLKARIAVLEKNQLQFFRLILVVFFKKRL